MNTILYTPGIYTTAAADVTEDVSLPDYIPEVRRIVGVRANPTVDGKYMTGDSLETDGCVTYTVLYTDGDGKLTQFSQTTPYTGKIPVQEDVQPAAMVVSASAEQIGCRVTAPAVWCGVRKGRQRVMPSSASNCPATEWILVTSSASSKGISGMMVGMHLASMVLPAPGGPTIKILCPPETATSIARLAAS